MSQQPFLTDNFNKGSNVTDNCVANNSESFIRQLEAKYGGNLAGVTFGQSRLPFELISTVEGQPLDEWVKVHKEAVDELLYRYGALLFRNFKVDSALKLQYFAEAYNSELLDYTDRGAPRVSLANRVFSSTEYAKEEVIPMHHEMSYAGCSPSKLFFCCEIAAQEGGYTPLADDREVIKQIPESIQQQFRQKKVMYVRNYGLGIDMGWQEAFDTNDKAEVEAYLQKTNTEFEWISDDHLRTTSVRHVFATHPVTGQTVWFNHAHLFHMSNMPDDIREMLIEEFGAEGLPRNAFYGDGTVIEDEVVEQITQIYKDNSVTFDWQVGDVLMLDNFLVSHGRTPFKGPRKVCVAMTELYIHPV